MSVEQLELFQNESEYERKIFSKAKKLKNIVQNFYRNSDSLITNKHHFEKYLLIYINVAIDQIRDTSPEEPSSPKMFIWKFEPSIILKTDKDSEVLLKQGESINNLIGAKIIPKWANELFTTNSFSHQDFLQFMSQYFTLETTLNVLESSELLYKIESESETKEVFFFLDTKLFSINFRAESPNEKFIIDRIGNLITKIKNLQRKNWFFIGQYDDFTKDKNFLAELDLNDKYRAKVEEDLELRDAESLVNIFNNDFLFVNNSEFFYQSYYQKNHNTDNWENNYILPPWLFNEDFTELKEITNKLDVGNVKERNFYSYHKKGAAERFFRLEFLLPNGQLSTKDFIRLINVADNFAYDK